MNTRPFFSIGIPVYNAEKYLRDTLNSILEQSFKDVEVILVNDGSKDRSEEIIKEFIEKDSRVKLISKKNAGPAAARNVALYRATGMYMGFIDSDDLLNPGVLEQIHKEITEADYPDVVSAGFSRIVGDKVIDAPNLYPGDESFPAELTADEKFVEWTTKHFIGHHCAKYYRTDFLRDNGISYYSRLWAQEDYEFMFHVYRKADRIITSDVRVFNYYKQRENSISTEWSYRAVLGVFSRWMDYFRDAELMQLSDRHRKMVADEKKKFISTIRRNSVSMPFNKTPADVMKFCGLIEHYNIDREIRRLPVKGESLAYTAIYMMYKLFGIKFTQKILCMLVKFKKK